jgi:hypothetical protein
MIGAGGLSPIPRDIPSDPTLLRNSMVQRSAHHFTSLLSSAVPAFLHHRTIELCGVLHCAAAERAAARHCRSKGCCQIDVQ